MFACFVCGDLSAVYISLSIRDAKLNWNHAESIEIRGGQTKPAKTSQRYLKPAQISKQGQTPMNTNKDYPSNNDINKQQHAKTINMMIS